jgi:cytochrome c-type biogenesis protein CcmH/NrfF
MPKRLLHIALLLAITLPMIGAADPGKRFDKLGHQLVCQCGCGQILLDCNHVGCPVSPGMITELHTQLDGPGASLPDAGIFNFFIAKYGAIVLAAPIRGGFDTVAWVVPFAVLLLGILGVIFLVRLWHHRHAQLPPAGPPPTTAATALRDRIRNETKYGD